MSFVNITPFETAPFRSEFSRRTVRMMSKSVASSFLIPMEQLPRVLFHGLLLACIICGFWLLDSLKDPIIANTIGMEYQPLAKFFSVLTTLIVVCIYDFATSSVSKPVLFHLVSMFYGLFILILAAYLADPVNGLGNREKNPKRYIGWICYFVIESYGSLMVALFWSFTNSIMDLEQAKGAYGLIISIAQIGAIIGSTFATRASQFGIPQLFIVGSMSIFSVSLLIKAYHITFKDPYTERIKASVRSSRDEYELLSAPPSLLKSFQRVFGGFFEGLMLIINYRYILTLLGISTAYEVVVTILDYEFKILGANNSSMHPLSLEDHGAGDGDRFANLLGHFGQLTNTLSFFVSFFGFSFLVHRLGVKNTLMIFPIILFIAVVVTNLSPSLWVLFVLVSVLKALIFSLNEPVKELLYIPTSEAIKFKAKAWIDVFGSRLSKGVGSFVTNLANGDAARLRNISEIPCIAVSIILIVLSWIIGTEFQRLVDNNITIGEAKVINYPLEEDLFLNHGGVRNGLKPGDVGYDGYDLHLFDGVFDDQEQNAKDKVYYETHGMSPIKLMGTNPNIASNNSNSNSSSSGSAAIQDISYFKWNNSRNKDNDGMGKHEAENIKSVRVTIDKFESMTPRRTNSKDEQK